MFLCLKNFFIGCVHSFFYEHTDQRGQCQEFEIPRYRKVGKLRSSVEHTTAKATSSFMETSPPDLNTPSTFFHCV